MELIEQILSQNNLKEAIRKSKLIKVLQEYTKEQLMNLIAISKSTKQKSKMQS